MFSFKPIFKNPFSRNTINKPITKPITPVQQPLKKESKKKIIGITETNNNLGKYVELNKKQPEIDILKIDIRLKGEKLYFVILDREYDIDNLFADNNINRKIVIRGDAMKEKKLKPLLIKKLKIIKDNYLSKLNLFKKMENILKNYDVKIVLFQLTIPDFDDFFVLISSKNIYSKDDVYKIPLNLFLHFLESKNENNLRSIRSIQNLNKRIQNNINVYSNLASENSISNRETINNFANFNENFTGRNSNLSVRTNRTNRLYL